MKQKIILSCNVPQKCNSKCIFCTYHGNSKWEPLFDYTVIDHYKTLNVGDTVFPNCGGEPLIYPELPKIINYCHERGFKTGINTNGILLDKADKEMLSQLNNLTVSALHDDPAVYEYLRPDGSYQQVWNNIKWLAERSPIPNRTVLTIVNAATYCDLASFTDRMKERGLNVAFNIQDHFFSDEGSRLHGILLPLFQVDLNRLRDELDQLIDRHPDVMSSEWANYIVEHFTNVLYGHFGNRLSQPICELKNVRIVSGNERFYYQCAAMTIRTDNIEELEKRVNKCYLYCGVQGGQCKYNPGFVREPLT